MGNAELGGGRTPPPLDPKVKQDMDDARDINLAWRHLDCARDLFHLSNDLSDVDGDKLRAIARSCAIQAYLMVRRFVS